MYKQAPEAIGIYSNYKIIGRIEEKEMKRNSKRFLALFLSVAMTVTPAVLTQAENEDANVDRSGEDCSCCRDSCAGKRNN